MLKREFAEGAIYMTMLQFPSEALLAAQDGPDALYRQGPLPCMTLKPFRETKYMCVWEVCRALMP